MAEVYINGDADIIHAPGSNDDVINDEEIIPKHDILAQGNIKVSTKDNIDIEKHEELNLEDTDSNDSGINSTYDINDNSELCNSVANEESPFASTKLNNDSNVVQNELINKQTNISRQSDLTNNDNDISGNNEHQNNHHEALNIKAVKLAANFQISSENVPNEISPSSSTSEATINKDVLEPSDEVAAIDSSDYASNSNVSNMKGESVLSEDGLSGIKMSDSHISTVDNVTLTESYIKISLDGNTEDMESISVSMLAENTNFDSTDVVAGDSEHPVLVDLANDLTVDQKNTAGTIEINEVIVNEDTSDDVSIDSSTDLQITNFVADVIEFAKTQQTSMTEIAPADNDEKITVESISDLEASKDELQEIPIIDLTNESTNSGADVLNKEAMPDDTSTVPAIAAIIEPEDETITFESKPIFLDDSNSSPIEIIDLTSESFSENKSNPIQILDDIDLTSESFSEDKSNPIHIVDDSDKITDNSTSSTEILNSISTFTEIVDDTKSSIKNGESDTVQIIDGSKSVPAEIVDTSTSDSKILDSTSVETITDLTVDLTSITTNVVMEDIDSAKVIDDSIPVPIQAFDNPESGFVVTLEDMKYTTEIIDSKLNSVEDVDDSKYIPTDTVNDDKIELSVQTPVSKVETVSGSAPGSDVVAEAPDTPEDEWLDILGNDLLKKKIIVKGKGKETRPPSGSIVNVRCEGKLADGTVVDKHQDLKFILSDEDVIQAFDLAVALMEDKETASVITDPRYAYGIRGRPDYTPPIPQNASITYEIEILSVKDGLDLEKMSDQERVLYGNQKRIRGNDLYAREEYFASINSYKRGIKYLDGSDDKNVMDMKIKCLNNLSAAQLQLKAYKMAVQSLDTVLQFEPENVKALFRKGKCLDGMKKEEEALECIKKASMLDPQNKSILQELGRLRSRVAVTHQKEKEMYQKMFTQKKDEKVSKEEEALNWSVKLTAGIVASLGMFLSYLWYKNR